MIDARLVLADVVFPGTNATTFLPYPAFWNDGQYVNFDSRSPATSWSAVRRYRLGSSPVGAGRHGRSSDLGFNFVSPCRDGVYNSYNRRHKNHPRPCERRVVKAARPPNITSSDTLRTKGFQLQRRACNAMAFFSRSLTPGYVDAQDIAVEDVQPMRSTTKTLHLVLEVTLVLFTVPHQHPPHLPRIFTVQVDTPFRTSSRSKRIATPLSRRS